jgi:hypothetical protein
MLKNRTVTSIDHSSTHTFRVLEPIKFKDEFSDWEYDHWQGLIDLRLEPHSSYARFPAIWRLTGDVSIHCRIINSESNKTLSPPSSVDRPQSELLKSFIYDVCAREKNSLSESWLKALRQEEIFDLEQLVSLDKKGWDRIHRLTALEKQKLKISIERYRTSTGWFVN